MVKPRVLHFLGLKTTLVEDNLGLALQNLRCSHGGGRVPSGDTGGLQTRAASSQSRELRL